jgi:hypothetical protein
MNALKALPNHPEIQKFKTLTKGDIVTVYRKMPKRATRKPDSGVILQIDRYKVVIRFLSGVESFTTADILDKTILFEKGEGK